MSRRKVSSAHNGKEEVPEVATIEYEVPDGGYGWVVVVCAFVFICMPMGVSASFAIYYEEWLDYFHAGIVSTSLIGSVGDEMVYILVALGVNQCRYWWYSGLDLLTRNPICLHA